MKYHSTPSVSKDEPSQLVYSPEMDEFFGIEKFADVFDLLEQNTIPVNDQIMGKIINFAHDYSDSGQ